jgi:hypothetical protein
MRFRLLVAAIVAAMSVVVVTGALATRGKESRSDGTLFAALNGKNEISPQGKKGAGDPDGRGGATVTIDGTDLCYGITVKNLDDPVLAHIHRGAKRENGPIVVPLNEPSEGDPGASSGCTTVSAQLAAAIRSKPRRYYVNVHTGAFPGGAVRGQLSGHKGKK